MNSSFTLGVKRNIDSEPQTISNIYNFNLDVNKSNGNVDSVAVTCDGAVPNFVGVNQTYRLSTSFFANTPQAPLPGLFKCVSNNWGTALFRQVSGV